MIRGSGKPTGDTPYVSPELIRSIGSVRILDLISEGPIGGLVNGDSSVFLDNTPLRDPISGKYNFLESSGASSVTVIAQNLGTPEQGHIPGFAQIESETAVGGEVLHDQPVIRRVDASIDRIRLRLAAPALYRIDGNGNTNPNNIKYVIEVKDSTLQDFPDIAEVQASVASTPLAGDLIPVLLPDYKLAMEYVIPAGATPSDVMSQLRYRLDMELPETIGFDGRPQPAVKIPVVVEIWGLHPVEGWSLKQSFEYLPNAPTHWIIDETCDVYALSRVQFRFSVGTDKYGRDYTIELYTEIYKRSVDGHGPPVLVGTQRGYDLYGMYTRISDSHFAIQGPAFTGNHPSKFEISTYDYALPGVGPWDIRVSKITEDSSDAKVQQTLQWESYTEIIDSKLSYPNCAVFGVVASARQFSNIPKRGYLVRLLIVQVPSNYFPETRKYTRNALGEDTGVEQGWDGTFYAAYTNNPAWCYYNLVSHPRYGLGKYVGSEKINKWALYTIGRYCDEMVDSGFRNPDGSIIYEPRFTLNCYIANRGQAYAVLQSLTSAFRGMVYWAEGKITAIQDSPAEAVHEFTNANVLDGVFTYSGSAKRSRHTAALVGWNDPGNSYKVITEYVDDPVGIRRYGFNPLEIPAFGCTSRGQAHRFGKWALYSEINETETCTHRVGLEGVFVVPGNVYKVMDSSRAGSRVGGRITEATVNSATLDAAVTLVAGRAYTISFVSMTTPPEVITVEVPVVAQDTATSEIPFLTPLGSAPAPGTVWLLEAPEHVEAQLFRCLACNEISSGVFEIAGLSHNPGKFAWVEQGVLFDTPSISEQLPIGAIIPPTGVMLSEDTKLGTTGLLAKYLQLTWNIVDQASISGYDAEYSANGGVTWTRWAMSDTNRCELVYPPAGTYLARVRSINAFGTHSEWTSTSYSLSPLYESPPDVTGLQLLGQANDHEFLGRHANFEWRRAMPPGTVSSQLEDQSYGVGKVYPANWLNGYVITVKNLDGTVRSTDFAVSEYWTYTFEMNARDGGGVPARTFIVEVAAETVWGTLSEVPGRITVSNPAPAALS